MRESNRNAGRGKITARDSGSFPELCPAEIPGRGKKNILESNNLPSPPRLSEFRKLAARRIGELCPPIPPQVKGKRAHGKELSEIRTTDFPDKQRFSEFRKDGKLSPYRC